LSALRSACSAPRSRPTAARTPSPLLRACFWTGPAGAISSSDERLRGLVDRAAATNTAQTIRGLGPGRRFPDENSRDLFDTLHDATGVSSGTRLLDVGCGSDWHARWLPLEGPR
jgi:hypothetical protein